MTEFKCIICGSRQKETGLIGSRAWGRIKPTFMPNSAPRFNRFFSNGAKITATACRTCGHLHFVADLEAIDELTGDGETRCRKCRYILKGLEQPRCPECGEPI